MQTHAEDKKGICTNAFTVLVVITGTALNIVAYFPIVALNP